jgi:signal transduction histidine kinase
VSKKAIATLTAALLLGLSGVRLGDLLAWRTQTLAAADERAANFASILSEYMRETFAAADASLRQLVLHNRRVGGPSAPVATWLPTLASARAGLTSVGSITVTDATGIIRYSTQPRIVGQSRRDDYAFKLLSSQAIDDLVVSRPYLSVVEPRQFLIPIARRLTNDQGHFDGLIVASFIPAAPRRFFRTLNVGRFGALWVFHPDGVVLYREPSANDPLGETATDNPIFAAARGGAESGTLRGPLRSSGPQLLSAFHSTTTPPLIVAVSLDRNEVLTEWRHQARASGLFFLALSVLTAVGLLVLFRQMDAKRVAEQALSEARDVEAIRLREVNERLAAALEGERRARGDAEAASTLKDEFLMTLSHELRTPLTAIQGWAHMLVAGDLDERRRQTGIETIDRNARVQTRLVNDLLDVSQAISGKLKLELRDVDLVALVRAGVETVHPAADAKRIRVDTDIAPGRFVVRGDPDRLQQVIWNLLSNAIKFTPSGGAVTVRLRRIEGNGAVDLIVSDTGIGIAPTFLPHVFERFRQGEAGTTRPYGGLGLGLAIVRHLVELHGGSVRAESAGVARGATFRVRLPMKPVD